MNDELDLHSVELDLEMNHKNTITMAHKLAAGQLEIYLAGYADGWKAAMGDE